MSDLQMKPDAQVVSMVIENMIFEDLIMVVEVEL
jgi:hypothetical protein